MLTQHIRNPIMSVMLLLLVACYCEAFAPITPSSLVSQQQQHQQQVISSSSKLYFEPSSSLDVAVNTLDPTTFLSDIFAGVVGTPLILAVPIVAALGVAGLLAFFIISYANPEVEDDE